MMPGGGPGARDQLLPHVDMVLLCVKSSDPARYQKVTQSHDARPHRTMLSFLAHTQRHHVRTWLRFVLMSARPEDGKFADVATDEEDEAGGVGGASHTTDYCPLLFSPA